MSEAEFWYSTPRYFFARQDAEIKRQQADMERARFIAFYIVKTVDGKDRYKTPLDVCRFDWDRDGEGGRLRTLEEEWAELDPEVLAKFSQEADEFLEQVQGKKQTQNGEHSAT